jgi:hypothetical protein
MEAAHSAKDLKQYYKNSVLAAKSRIFSLYAHPDI